MKRLFIPAIVLTLCALSCAKSSDTPGQEKDKSLFEESVKEVIAYIDPFVDGNQTKNTFDKTTEKWTWAGGDKIGFWSDPSTDGIFGNPAHVVFDVQINPGDTLFHGNGYGILRDCTYHTYYPYNATSTATCVPITYIGQNPQESGGVGHLGNYDYMYSTQKTPTSGKVAFTYHHLGCITEYIITVANPWPDVKFNKLTITAPDGQTLVSNADFNPSTSALSKTYASSIVYNLGANSGQTGIELQNNQIDIYTMASPAQVSGKEFTITLNDDAGHTYKGYKTLATNQQAGWSYSYSINVSDASVIKDLSELECANCYIVSAAGDYKFKTKQYGQSSDIANISSAEVYWETNNTTTAPTAGSIIKSVRYAKDGNDGYILFNKPSDAKGNALIVAKNGNTVLWSWHIWCTDKPNDEVYRCGAGTLMDRNLGALSKEGDTSTGLFYQWGRKDPFMGNASIASNTGIAASCSTGVSFGSVARSTAGSTNSSVINYAVQHPTTFIQGASNDWLPNGQTGTDGLWRKESANKTIDDPCPPGYKVAEGSRDNSTTAGRGVYGTAFNTNYILNNWSTDHWSVSGTSYGSYNITLSNNVMSVPLENGGSALYPVAGYLSESYGRNGNNILIWTNYHQSAGGSASTAWTNVHSGCLDINTNNHEIKVNWTSGRAAGKPVRCQKINTQVESNMPNEGFNSASPSEW